MTKIVIKTEDGFFSYESGGIVYDATLMTGSKIRATTWNEDQIDHILSAYDYAVKKGYDPEFVKVTVKTEKVDIDFEEKVKENAMKKLTKTERQLLGLQN